MDTRSDYIQAQMVSFAFSTVYKVGKTVNFGDGDKTPEDIKVFLPTDGMPFCCVEIQYRQGLVAWKSERFYISHNNLSILGN